MRTFLGHLRILQNLLDSNSTTHASPRSRFYRYFFLIISTSSDGIFYISVDALGIPRCSHKVRNAEA